MPPNLVTSSFKTIQPECPVVPAIWRGNTTNVTYAAGTTPVETHLCTIQFTIPDNLKPPVLFYYRLTNFYQNHRRYVKSLDSDQLNGKAVDQSKTGTCDPLRQAPNNKTYYPCGLIANSMFNDTFTNPVQLNLHDRPGENITYNMTEDNIAWSSDTNNLYKKTSYNNSAIAPPPNWYLQYQNGYSDENPPRDLHEWQAFQVWMRTAGLPAFSKLAKRNDNETMQCSRYQVQIQDSKCRKEDFRPIGGKH